MILPSSVFLKMNLNSSSFLTSDGSQRKKQMFPPEIHSVLQALGFSFQVLLSVCSLPEACELYCLLFKLFIILFSCFHWWHTPLFLVFFDCFVCVKFYYTGLKYQIQLWITKIPQRLLSLTKIITALGYTTFAGLSKILVVKWKFQNSSQSLFWNWSFRSNDKSCCMVMMTYNSFVIAPIRFIFIFLR